MPRNRPLRSDRSTRSLPRAWRWFGIAARTLHLAAVILLGAALLGSPLRVSVAGIGGALLASGALLFTLDQWKSGAHAFQLAGAGQIAKLALVAWMTLDPATAPPLFWIIVAWSSVLSHAPASFRHMDLRDVLGLRRQPVDH